MSKVSTVVHGGTVAFSSHAQQTSIAIDGEKIVAVGPLEAMPEAETYIDATGKHVLPGGIDCHVHLRPNPGDDWEVGSVAAAHAGLTTIIPFGAYNKASTGSLTDNVKSWQEEAERDSVVDFAFHYVLGNNPDTFDGLEKAIEMGVASYKMFMTYDHRVPDLFIARVMEVVGANGGIVQLHAENGEMIDFLMKKATIEGRTSPKDFPATCPDYAEGEAINRGILMGAMTDCPVYIVHLSTKIGLERIKQAQMEGQRVWTETCPQYMLLDETEMERLGPLAKIGPPLRSADRINQEAMWKGTIQGYVSSIGSDHSPGPAERKAGGWENIFRGPDGQAIPFGAPSIETLIPLMYSEGVMKRGLPLWWMARALGENPARIFGLYPRKGVIQPGSDADLLIFDPEAELTIKAADHKGTSGFTPYEGRPIKGKPWMTLLRGRILLKDGVLHQKAGSGKYIPAGPPMPPMSGNAA